jgi:hypothetical protein
MIVALAGTVAAAVAVAAAPGTAARPDSMTVTVHATAAEAVRAALAGPPVVMVGFGEIHQTVGTAGIPSALRRFSEQILPVLAPEVSHLIVETWVATGRCGEVERAVTADIEKTTERPAATENEIETVLRRAASAGVVPRILSIGCAEYQAMRPAGRPVDYDRTLRVTARALETAALRALPERRRPLIAVYGGALHNDVHPNPFLAAYSYVPALMTATLGQYVEIDLVVPEYVAPAFPPGNSKAQGTRQARETRAKQSRENRAKYDWWAAYQSAPGAGESAGEEAGESASQSVTLIRRSSRSFVIVFPRVLETERR